MLEQFEALVEEYDMLPMGSIVLCAVSGGADSMCLLHLLKGLEATRGITVIAAHFNHKLRGAESDRDEKFVFDFCRAGGIPLHLGSGDVGREAARRGCGIEETARSLRYDFLRSVASAAESGRIATAHTADDNAETLLLHLIRGTGLQGLTGIPPRRGALVRPLLTTARCEVEAYLQAHSVPHIEDSSNGETAYARNRLRHQVMPLLKRENPRLTQGLTDTMRYLRADNDFLNAQAAAVCGQARRIDDDLAIEARLIADLPDAIAPRAARQLLGLMGGDNCAGEHLLAIVRLCRGDDPSALCFLPDGLLAQRVYGDLLLTVQGEVPTFAPVPLPLNGDAAVCAWRVTCRPSVCPPVQPHRADHFYLAAPLTGAVLRPRQTGDEISLPGRGRKTLKKLLIDEKVPRRVREQIPVLADEGGLLAVAGFGPDAARLAAPGAAAYEIVLLRLQG